MLMEYRTGSRSYTGQKVSVAWYVVRLLLRVHDARATARHEKNPLEERRKPSKPGQTGPLENRLPSTLLQIMEVEFTPCLVFGFHGHPRQSRAIHMS